MSKNQNNSSSQIMIALFVCLIFIPLVQSIYNKTDISFPLAIIAAVISTVFIFLMFIPTIVIGKKTGLDFISYASKITPNAIIFTAAFYGLYFVYTAVYFLTNYTDMMIAKVNPDANKYVIALLVLAACSYGAWKSANALIRCAVFLFAFIFIALLLIFCGNISNIDFQNADLQIAGSIPDFIKCVSYLEVGAVVSIIFSCLSGGTQNFNFRRLIAMLAGYFIVLALSIFFIFFVLSDFGKFQSYQFSILSKTTQLGNIKEFDSIFLIISTMSAFMLISVITVCMSKITNCPEQYKINGGFCLLVFILYLCTENNFAVKQILLNSNVIMILTIIGAIIIPCGYLSALRRIKND